MCGFHTTGADHVPKTLKRAAAAVESVRTRRAYFDCRFGQLHVRTAFPTTGGFDEQVTLICLHGSTGASRVFARFLPLIAEQRSVYAPDLPGSGESDAADAGREDHAGAIADLASELRLRQIDVLGFDSGAEVAVELAIAAPNLVRRVVLVAAVPSERWPLLRQPTWVLSIGAPAPPNRERGRGLPPNVRQTHVPEYAADLFTVAAQTLATQFAQFLGDEPGA
jgi:pimeloyl-ACP methyl ester carboxylesterase